MNLLDKLCAKARLQVMYEPVDPKVDPQIYHVSPLDAPYRPHNKEFNKCWCEPEVHFVDPETGRTVYRHRRFQ